MRPGPPDRGYPHHLPHPAWTPPSPTAPGTSLNTPLQEAVHAWCPSIPGNPSHPALQHRGALQLPRITAAQYSAKRHTMVCPPALCVSLMLYATHPLQRCNDGVDDSTKVSGPSLSPVLHLPHHTCHSFPKNTCKQGRRGCGPDTEHSSPPPTHSAHPSIHLDQGEATIVSRSCSVCSLSLCRTQDKHLALSCDLTRTCYFVRMIF